MKTPPSRPRDLGGQEAEVEVGCRAGLGGVEAGVHVDDVGADGHVHGHGQAEPRPGGQDAPRLEGGSPAARMVSPTARPSPSPRDAPGRPPG